MARYHQDLCLPEIKMYQIKKKTFFTNIYLAICVLDGFVVVDQVGVGAVCEHSVITVG